MQQDGPATVTQGSTEDGGLTVTQAATQLGISTDSVRRRLKADELAGHQRQAKHGPTWCVHPDEPPGLRNGPATVEPTVAPESREGSATVPPGLADSEEPTGQPEQAAGMALMQAEAMAAYTRSVLEPLVAALERSEGRVAELERENGRLNAENAVLEARTAAQGVEPPASAPVPWRHVWRPWVFALAALLVAAGLLASSR